MNAGMYGMADGCGMNGRKFIGRVGTAQENASAVSPQVGASVGVARAATAPLSAGVRTRLVSVTGKGALRYFAADQSSGLPQVTNLEVWLDGVSVYSTAGRSLISGSAWIACGAVMQTAGGSQCGVLDFWPFDQSCEVFITLATYSSPVNYLSVIDLHQ